MHGRVQGLAPPPLSDIYGGILRTKGLDITLSRLLQKQIARGFPEASMFDADCRDECDIFSGGHRKSDHSKKPRTRARC